MVRLCLCAILVDVKFSLSLAIRAVVCIHIHVHFVEHKEGKKEKKINQTKANEIFDIQNAKRDSISRWCELKCSITNRHYNKATKSKKQKKKLPEES